MSYALRLVDLLTRITGYFAAFGILLMIGVILYEVTLRYFFNAPTVWAYDVSYMLNGTVIMLAGALAMKGNQHVVIDIVSQLFRDRTKTIIEVTIFSLLLLPTLGFIGVIAWGQFWRALQNGTVEHVSPWRPLMWPFRLMIAVGLSVLWLQILAKTAVSVQRLFAGRKTVGGGV